MNNRYFAGVFSVFSGLSTAVSIGYAMALETDSLSIGVISGVMALVADTIATYYFQGQTILESQDKQAKQLASVTDPGIESEREEEESQKCDRQTGYSIATQSLYTTLDGAKILGNNYFFLAVIPQLFSMPLSRPAFCTALAVLTIIKEFFNLTNAGFEANKQIAEKFTGNGSKPFYARFFKPCAGTRARKTISFVGSLNHALFDDLLPWVALLPPAAIKYLSENPVPRDIVITLGTLLGIPLTALLLLQTWLYEGKHTKENLLSLNMPEDISDSANAPLLKHDAEPPPPLALIDASKKTIGIMGPLHGVAAAVPIYIVAKLIPGNTYLVNALAGIAALISAWVISKGTDASEVAEARKELGKMRQERVVFDKKKPQTVTIDSSDDSATNDKRSFFACCRV